MSNPHQEPRPQQAGTVWMILAVLALVALLLRSRITWAVQHWMITAPIAVAVIALGTWGYLYWSTHRKTKGHTHSAAKKMGTGKDLAPSAADAAQVSEVAKVSGMKLGEAVTSGKPVAAGGRDSCVALIGPGGGKSAALVIPLALEGCVDGDGLEPSVLLTTSNKVDVWNAIRFGRSRIPGATQWCFNPQYIAHEKPTWWWNFATYVLGEVHGEVHAEVHAEALAQLFSNATIKSDAKKDPYFDEEGPHFLADLLLAAALSGKPIQQVFLWLTNLKVRDYVKILEDGGYALPAAHAKSMFYLPDEQRAGIFGVALRCVQFCNNRRALRWISPLGPDDNRPVFDPKAFVRSQADTLVLLSREGVGSFGPLVAAMTVAVTEAAEEYAEECEGGHLPRAMKVILDEVANVCKWEELPNQFSHYPGRGIFLFAFLQSWAQGCRVWGVEGMKQMWSTATIKILGPGDAEPDLLKDMVDLIGNHWVEKRSTGVSVGGSATGGSFSLVGGNTTHSTATSYEWRPIMEVADLHALPAWTNVVLASKTRPFLMKSLPYFDPPGSPLDQLVEESKARSTARLKMEKVA